MAEHDVILTLQFDEGPPALGSCGAALYAAVAPLAYADEENGWPLAHLCEALGRMRQAVSDMVRAWDETIAVDDGPEGYRQTIERSGWSRATHPDHAPGAREAAGAGGFDMLPFLGQLVGVRGIEGLTDDDRRAAIRERAGFSRGRPRSIVSLAARYTDGTPGAVRLRERYDPASGLAADAPYHGRVLIKRSRVSDLARVNMIANPRAEVDTSTVTITADGLTSAVLGRVAWGWNEIAEWGYRATATQAAGDSTPRTLAVLFGGSGRAAQPVVPGRPYTISAQIAPLYDSWPGRDGIRWAVRWFDADGDALSIDRAPVQSIVGVWEGRTSRTFVAPTGAAFGQFGHEYKNEEPNRPIGFEMTAVMLEQTREAGPFADALTPGWRSLGTPHASPSQGPGISADKIEARVRRRIPAGLVYDVVISDDRDYDTAAPVVGGRRPTYDDLKNQNIDYDDLLEG